MPPRHSFSLEKPIQVKTSAPLHPLHQDHGEAPGRHLQPIIHEARPSQPESDDTHVFHCPEVNRRRRRWNWRRRWKWRGCRGSDSGASKCQQSVTFWSSEPRRGSSSSFSIQRRCQANSFWNCEVRIKRRYQKDYVKVMIYPIGR